MTGPAKAKPGGKDRPMPRSAARIAAVQALYQMDLAATDINQVIEQFTLHRLPDARQSDAIYGADPVFMADILRGVVRRQRDIDPVIEQTLATGWRLTRIDSILRAILRAGSFELLERPDVPARVVINEYINVAHAFFSDDEPRVVNGVLDKLARQHRSSELAARDKESPAGDG